MRTEEELVAGQVDDDYLAECLKNIEKHLIKGAITKKDQKAQKRLQSFRKMILETPVWHYQMSGL